MCPCIDIFQYDLLEVPTGNATVVNKHIIPILFKVLENCQCPGHVGATIADENRFLDASHSLPARPEREN
jgi:hypothetical protein